MREHRSTRRGGRRGTGPSLDMIYWRDIPAQLTARLDGEQEKVLLDARFQHAIDRAAAVAELTATDDYVNEWRVVPEPLAPLGDATPGSGVAAMLETRCAEIEAAYPRDRLEALVATGGVEPTHLPDSPDSPDSPNEDDT